MRHTKLVGWSVSVALGAFVAACGGDFGAAANDDGGSPSTDGDAPGADARADHDGLKVDGQAPDGGSADATTADTGVNDTGTVLDTGTVVDAGTIKDTGIVVDTGVIVDTGVDVDQRDACTLAQPNPNVGVFASPGGQSSACGSAAIPCNSIQTAINLAQSSGKSIVYVDHGTYTESLTLVSGIQIQGGWLDVGGSWSRQCGPTNAAGTVVKAPSNANKTIVASSVTGVTIDTLTVASKDAASVGTSESIYGIFSTSSNLALVNVVVSVVGAGAGQTGGGGGSGSSGGTGCSVGDGVGGAAGGGGAVATGTFGPSGYSPGNGGTGGAGMTGHNGTASSPAFTCVNGVQCVENFASDGCQDPLPVTQSCGTAGTSGCGGQPGTGSSGGTGGGSSVAVYVWGGSVTSAQGAFDSGSGGNGGSAGSPGGGGSGGTGTAGGNGFRVITSCKIVNTSQCTNNATAAGGVAGGPGGPGGIGGTGGAGGGGAGGYAYSYYTGGGASVSPSGTTFLFGAAGGGGNGGNAGPSGVAAQHN